MTGRLTYYGNALDARMVVLAKAMYPKKPKRIGRVNKMCQFAMKEFVDKMEPLFKIEPPEEEGEGKPD